MVIFTLIFFKIADDKEPFHVQWYGGENAIIYGHDKNQGRRRKKNARKEKNGYVAPCANVGFMRNASMNSRS